MTEQRLYTVYANPSDYPGHVVVRGTTVRGDKKIPDAFPIYVGTDIHDARIAIVRRATLRGDEPPENIGRHDKDNPAIAEVWR